MSFDSSRYRAPERVNLRDRRWPCRALERAPTWCSVELRDTHQALPDPMGHERKRALRELLARASNGVAMARAAK
jgi:2-isopropylmalate synthase